jgi:superfamily II DNA or RNA helicase
MTTLREYQQTAIDQLRANIMQGKKRLILCSPTGAGKTVMFSYMVAAALQKGKRCIIFTDRIELLRQADGSLARFNITASLIEASKGSIAPDAACYIAMAQTFIRRKANPAYADLLNAMDLIIIDECHRQVFNNLLDLINPNAVVIGATATPLRRGKQTCLSKFYQNLINPVQVSELIQLGFLSDPVSFGTQVDLSGIGMKGDDYDTSQMAQRYSERKVYAGVLSNYARLCDRKKSIVFASNIASSQEICDAFQMAGYPARHVDGEMSKKERAAVLRWFKNSPNGILCNCDLMTTGYDEPTIEVVILYRATASLPLFMQMVGRGSRVTETKKRFIILDFGNNIQSHGYWEQDREWSLKKKQMRKKAGVAGVKSCPNCEALIPPSTRVCKYCGQIIEQKPKDPPPVAELQLLTKADGMKLAKNADIAAKAKLAKAKVISPFWVLHNCKSKDEALQFVSLMGWKKGWLFHNAKRFKILQ